MTKLLLAMLVAGAAALSGAARAQGADPGQAEQFTPEFQRVHTTADPKHSPKIEAPDSVRRGQWFQVTVTVGAGSMHPSLQEHFVRYIALYKRGRLSVNRLLTGHLKLDQINEGFDRLNEGKAIRQVVVG